MILGNFFKNSAGKTVLWQSPNIPLCGWLLFKLAAIASNNQSQTTTLNGISTTFLLIWATLEITSGVNHFRRALGVVVFVATVTHYL